MNSEGVNYFGGSSTSVFNELFAQIEMGEIRDLAQLEAYAKKKTASKLSLYLSNAIRETKDPHVVLRLKPQCRRCFKIGLGLDEVIPCLLHALGRDV